MPSTPIPTPDCISLLTRIVSSYVSLLKDINNNPKLGLSFPIQMKVLSLAIWLEGDESLSQTDFNEVRSYFLTTSPYASAQIRGTIEELLRTDNHLRLTCQNALGFALAIELLSFPLIERLSRVKSVTDDACRKVTEHLTSQLFMCDYKREAYLHVYNLVLPDGVCIKVPNSNILISEVNEQLIPHLTGEFTIRSFLHDHSKGNIFVQFVDEQVGSENEWMQEKWVEAYKIVQVFKYYKYGIVDIDYSGIYFRPQWVNQIRKQGIDMWGSPRRDVQSESYILTSEDVPKLQLYMDTSQKFVGILEDLSKTLRKSLELAGNYYEVHSTRSRLEDQLIDLVIALEALFSPGKEGELRFRISQRAAILLGNNPTEKLEIAGFIKKMYDARSKLVHEGKSPFLNGDLSNVEVIKLGNYVRNSILRLLTMLFRGETKIEKVRTNLDECAFNEALIKKIQEDSDIDKFLKIVD